MVNLLKLKQFDFLRNHIFEQQEPIPLPIIDLLIFQKKESTLYIEAILKSLSLAKDDFREYSAKIVALLRKHNIEEYRI